MRGCSANTFTGTTISQSGGNSTASQTTTGLGNFTIFYTYDNSTATPPPPTGVPEPATMALLGAGWSGIGMTRRRRSV